MTRTFIAHSPMGDQLEFRSLEGSEQISRLFEHRVRMISQSASISAKALLGKDLSIEIDLTTEVGGGGKPLTCDPSPALPLRPPGHTQGVDG